MYVENGVGQTLGVIRQVAFSSAGEAKKAFDYRLCQPVSLMDGRSGAIYQLKGSIHIIGREIGPFAVNVQKAVLGGCVEHGLTHIGVVGVGDVDDGEVNRRSHRGSPFHFDLAGDRRIMSQADRW
jgi:hypothetical protein